MIPTLSKYLQQLHYERDHWLTKAERRRAFWLISGITLCVTALLYLWLLR